MTAPTASVADFYGALTPDTRAKVHTTARNAQNIDAALRRGWTVTALVHFATDNTGSNVGGIVTSRLARAAHNDPPANAPTVTTFATFTQPRKPCGQCDPITRWALTEAGEPARRCECWTRPNRGSS